MHLKCPDYPGVFYSGVGTIQHNLFGTCLSRCPYFRESAFRGSTVLNMQGPPQAATMIVPIHQNCF